MCLDVLRFLRRASRQTVKARARVANTLGTRPLARRGQVEGAPQRALAPLTLGKVLWEMHHARLWPNGSRSRFVRCWFLRRVGCSRSGLLTSRGGRGGGSAHVAGAARGADGTLRRQVPGREAPRPLLALDARKGAVTMAENAGAPRAPDITATGQAGSQRSVN